MCLSLALSIQVSGLVADLKQGAKDDKAWAKEQIEMLKTPVGPKEKVKEAKDDVKDLIISSKEDLTKVLRAPLSHPSLSVFLSISLSLYLYNYLALAPLLSVCAYARACVCVCVCVCLSPISYMCVFCVDMCFCRCSGRCPLLFLRPHHYPQVIVSIVLAVLSQPDSLSKV
jgi:hypothetical protein